MDLNARIDEAVKTRLAANDPIWKLIREVRRNSDLAESEKSALLSTLFGSLSDKDVIEILAYDALAYDTGTSFRSSMNDLQRLKKRMRAIGFDIFPGDNSKLKDREFAASLGIPVPKIYFEDVPLERVELIPNSILKPVEGVASKGVFYVTGARELRSIRTSSVYPSIREAREEIARHGGAISTDRWILEEAILSKAETPAKDFKVFAFYGVNGMFLEIDRYSYPETRFATYTETGRQIDRGGKYVSFPGTGIPKDLREMSHTISLASPVPFLRLDFYAGLDGLYLGEITPLPGGTYAGDQKEEVDRMLGHHFADASARLFVDLLNGKEFLEFKSVYDIS